MKSLLTMVHDTDVITAPKVWDEETRFVGQNLRDVLHVQRPVPARLHIPGILSILDTNSVNREFVSNHHYIASRSHRARVQLLLHRKAVLMNLLVEV